MRLEKSEAIVLYTTASRERDKLVVFLTPEDGKRKGWAYGARSARGRYGAALEPLAKIHITYSERENEEVVRIDSVDLIRSLFSVQQTLDSSVAASYLAELADKFAQPEEPSHLLYRLLDRSSESLLGGGHAESVVAYAEIWMMKLAGVFPSFQNCAQCSAPLEKQLSFEARYEGFVCASCATPLAESIEPATLDLLRILLRSTAESFGIAPVNARALRAVRRLARRLRAGFLDKELRSYEMFQNVLARQGGDA